MIIPAITMIEPAVLQIEAMDDNTLMLAFAELSARIPRLKAELNRQRDANQDLRGDVLRQEYAVQTRDETIERLEARIEVQDQIIRRQQAKLDGRMTAIRELRAQWRGHQDAYHLELEHTQHLAVQLDALRQIVMHVPFVNGGESWVETGPDDVSPLEQGFRVQYAKLDPETFEINGYLWFRAD
jgi:hypothetical protein